MKRIAFANLPAVVQIMTLVSMFMAWVMLEEFVIDRHHWDRFLPLYRYGNLCLYDLAAALLIVGFGLSLRANRGRSSTVDSG